MHLPSYGYTTCILRKEFIEATMHPDLHTNPEILTLNACENNSDTLYFWQLYSILGEQNITTLITSFYENVFNDTDDASFSTFFKDLGTLDYHIKGQTGFWLDAMGGGKRYPGGEHRLKRHHDLAKRIMNEHGALRWLHHMRKSLNNSLVDLTGDPRVKSCIITFINFFMKKYGDEYNFKSRL